MKHIILTTYLQQRTTSTKKKKNKKKKGKYFLTILWELIWPDSVNPHFIVSSISNQKGRSMLYKQVWTWLNSNLVAEMKLTWNSMCW